MIPRQIRRPAFQHLPNSLLRLTPLLQLLVHPQILHRKTLHIHFIDPLLHRRIHNLPRRIIKMPRQSRMPPEHAPIRYRPHPPLRINHIRPNEQLLALPVNHPVRRRPPNALRPNHLLQLRRDLIQLVRRPLRQMRPVRNHPQAPSPRHHRPSPALALVVEHRQMRINPRNLPRRTHHDVG